MECEQLKNFGNIFTCKPSARVVMTFLTSAPPDVGLINTPKFLVKLANRGHFWQDREFEAARERGISNPEVVSSIKTNVLALYSALRSACSKEKALRVYTKFSEKMGLMMYEEFFPSAQDFLGCQDPWEALQQYVMGFLGAWKQAGIARFQVLRSTDGELWVQMTDCGLNAIYQEAGYPEVASVGCQGNCQFLSRLADDLGGSFERDSWLCRGDKTCDWHFRCNGVAD